MFLMEQQIDTRQLDFDRGRPKTEPLVLYQLPSSWTRFQNTIFTLHSGGSVFFSSFTMKASGQFYLIKVGREGSMKGLQKEVFA